MSSTVYRVRPNATPKNKKAACQGARPGTSLRRRFRGKYIERMLKIHENTIGLIQKGSQIGGSWRTSHGTRIMQRLATHEGVVQGSKPQAQPAADGLRLLFAALPGGKDMMSIDFS